MLAWWSIEFPKTHVIARLTRLIERRDAELAVSLMDAIVPTPYAATLRYPGNRPEVGEAEMADAMRITLLVRETIVPLLPIGED